MYINAVLAMDQFDPTRAILDQYGIVKDQVAGQGRHYLVADIAPHEASRHPFAAQIAADLMPMAMRALLIRSLEVLSGIFHVFV
jgi:hypothetical protein